MQRIVFTSDVARIIQRGEGLMYKLNYKFLQFVLGLLLNNFIYRMANIIVLKYVLELMKCRYNSKNCNTYVKLIRM